MAFHSSNPFSLRALHEPKQKADVDLCSGFLQYDALYTKTAMQYFDGTLSINVRAPSRRRPPSKMAGYGDGA